MSQQSETTHERTDRLDLTVRCIECGRDLPKIDMYQTRQNEYVCKGDCLREYLDSIE